MDHEYIRDYLTTFFGLLAINGQYWQVANDAALARGGPQGMGRTCCIYVPNIKRIIIITAVSNIRYSNSTIRGIETNKHGGDAWCSKISKHT